MADENKKAIDVDESTEAFWKKQLNISIGKLLGYTTSVVAAAYFLFTYTPKVLKMLDCAEQLEKIEQKVDSLTQPTGIADVLSLNYGYSLTVHFNNLNDCDTLNDIKMVVDLAIENNKCPKK